MISRRDFIKAISFLTANLNLPLWADIGVKKNDRCGDLLPMRPLGNTGESVTMLGVGGSHIGDMNEKEAQKTIETAIEGGVRFFDSAEGYQDGRSEQYLGRFLTPKYRDEVFLMTKCEQNNYDDAMNSLESSLKRLNTDYLDLWQVHTLESVEDVENRVDGGIIRAMTEAKKSGKVHCIGFTGHATPRTHQLMLKITSEFQTCQMPMNVCDPSYKSFIVDVLPVLIERNMGVLAMKTLGEGSFVHGRMESKDSEKAVKPLVPHLLSIKEALYFAWSLPISVLITGPDNAEMLDEKIKLARSFANLTESDRQKLIERVSDVAVKGALEDYKYGEY
jgi:aryl-alcohol dehydrogenase-like predicted oxidoreductase